VKIFSFILLLLVGCESTKIINTYQQLPNGDLIYYRNGVEIYRITNTTADELGQCKDKNGTPVPVTPSGACIV
jgi:hypothetical protein